MSNLPIWFPERTSTSDHIADLKKSEFIRGILGEEGNLYCEHFSGITQNTKDFLDSIFEGLDSISKPLSHDQSMLSPGLFLLNSSNSKAILHVHSYKYGDSQKEEIIGEIVSSSENLFKSSIEKINNNLQPFENSDTVSILIKSLFGLTETRIPRPSLGIEENNYNKNVLDSLEIITKEIKSENPNGRFILLDGPPGTGKTFLIKGLMKELEESSFLIIPQSQETDVSSTAFLSLLLSRSASKRKILILEDADNLIRPRKESTTASVSALLNIADGIISAALDVIIIATTNADLDSIDSALLRPGRLMERMTVGLLTPEKASEVYKRLTGEERKFEEEVSLAEVYLLSKKTKSSVKELRDIHQLPTKQIIRS